MNKKEFIPYTEALALKELGFNEPCFGYHNVDYGDESLGLSRGGGHINTTDKKFPSAPLYQQAFRWFRNKGFGLDIYSAGNDNKDWYYIIKKGTIDTSDVIYKTYEEAELACLKKLIEITLLNKKQ